MSHFDSSKKQYDRTVADALLNCRYFVSDHVCVRWLERVDCEAPIEGLHKVIVNTVKAGRIVFEHDKYMYVMNGSLFFPLKRKGHRYTIRTVYSLTENINTRVEKLKALFSRSERSCF